MDEYVWWIIDKGCLPQWLLTFATLAFEFLVLLPATTWSSSERDKYRQLMAKEAELDMTFPSWLPWSFEYVDFLFGLCFYFLFYFDVFVFFQLCLFGCSFLFHPVVIFCPPPMCFTDVHLSHISKLPGLLCHFVHGSWEPRAFGHLCRLDVFLLNSFVFAEWNIFDLGLYVALSTRNSVQTWY